jgi:hypothetical protein
MQPFDVIAKRLRVKLMLAGHRLAWVNRANRRTVAHSRDWTGSRRRPDPTGSSGVLRGGGGGGGHGCTPSLA